MQPIETASLFSVSFRQFKVHFIFSKLIFRGFNG